jgi:hypothetical protein
MSRTFTRLTAPVLHASIAEGQPKLYFWLTYIDSTDRAIGISEVHPQSMSQDEYDLILKSQGSRSDAAKEAAESIIANGEPPHIADWIQQVRSNAPRNRKSNSVAVRCAYLRCIWVAKKTPLLRPAAWAF